MRNTFLCSLTVALLLPLASLAQTFSGAGSGTESDPYQIETAAQLAEVDAFSQVCFKLMNDLDLTDHIAASSPTDGWMPVRLFRCSFDGNGKTVKGLYINRTTTDNVGLFGLVTSGSISNLTVEGSVTGRNYVGGVAGQCKLYNSSSPCTLSSVSFRGTVNATQSAAGGLCGYFNDTYTGINSTITNCGVHANIVSANTAGGLVGHANLYLIQHSWFVGTIGTDNCASQYAGGIAGRSNSRISGCYSRGLVYGSVAGGIAGFLESTKFTYSDGSYYSGILYSQFKGDVHGLSGTGGIVGDMRGGYLTSDISRGRVFTSSMNGNIGGSIGYASSATIGSSTDYVRIAGLVAAQDLIEATTTGTQEYIGRIAGYYTSKTSFQGETTTGANLASSDMVVTNNGAAVDVSQYKHNGKSLTYAQLQDKQTYVDAAWDFDNIWKWDAGLNDSFPFAAQTEEVVDEVTQLDALGSSYTVTIGTTHYATFYHSTAMQLPADVKAGVVTGLDDNHLQIDWLYDGSDDARNVVPGGLPVLLYSVEEGEKTLVPQPFDFSVARTVNLLCGSDADQTDNEAGYYYFVLSLNEYEDAGSVGFYYQPGTDGLLVNNTANRAYLKIRQEEIHFVPASFPFDNSLTDIALPAVSATGGTRRPAVYTLDGRRVPTNRYGTFSVQGLNKGIYVVGGRKMAVP